MPNPVTETILVTYLNNQFTFADVNGSAISGGDLSAYPGANSFTFKPATGETWKFYSATLTATAQNGTSTGMGLNDDFTLRISGLRSSTTQLVIDDKNREVALQEYEYAFKIRLANGSIVPCDPKIYNRIS